jgi:hypothetical protein
MSHKSIPCPNCNRIWMWLEHATPENPVCPEGHGCSLKIQEPTIVEILERILKRLDAIEMKINRIQPVYPTAPVPPRLNSTVCSKCGMEWKGVMGYVCSRNDCPVQVKVTSQTYNTSTTSFDIESLDPDQRSWYYDGDGTKRKKE